MENNNVIMKKGAKFYFLEFIGSLVLFVLLGFPFWIPLIFIVNDMLANNNPLIMYIVGNKGSAMVVVETLLKYVVFFIPGAILLYWYKTTDEKQKNKIVDFTASSDDEYRNKISWKPKGITGNPSNNKKWVTVKPGVMTFKSTYQYQIFTYPAIIGGFFYSVVNSISNESALDLILNYGFLTMIVALILNSLFYILGLSGLVLSINKGILQVGVNAIKIEQVEAIQVLRKRQSHSNGGELYDVYEANIIYLGGQRHNFLNHGDLYEIAQQIKKINKYLKVNVVADDETLEDIEKHNQEANLDK